VNVTTSSSCVASNAQLSQYIYIVVAVAIVVVVIVVTVVVLVLLLTSNLSGCACILSALPMLSILNMNGRSPTCMQYSYHSSHIHLYVCVQVSDSVFAVVN
jgi:hypothetical protein